MIFGPVWPAALVLFKRVSNNDADDDQPPFIFSPLLVLLSL